MFRWTKRLSFQAYVLLFAIAFLLVVYLVCAAFPSWNDVKRPATFGAGFVVFFFVFLDPLCVMYDRCANALRRKAQ